MATMVRMKHIYYENDTDTSKTIVEMGSSMQNCGDTKLDS